MSNFISLATKDDISEINDLILKETNRFLESKEPGVHFITTPTFLEGLVRQGLIFVSRDSETNELVCYTIFPRKKDLGTLEIYMSM